VGRGGPVVVPHPADAVGVGGRIVPGGEDHPGEGGIPVGERGLAGRYPAVLMSVSVT
jgi:hypothetical protein